MATKHLFSAVVGTLLVIWVAVPPSLAQQPIPVQPIPAVPAQGVAVPMPPKDMESYLTEMTKRTQESLQIRMNLQISDIQRECNLSESQKKRLTIAAKGAIKSYLKKWKASYERMLAGVDIRPVVEIGNDEAEGAGDAGRGDPAEAPVLEIAQPPLIAAPIPFNALASGDGMNETEVMKETLWINAFDKTLSDEQKAKYAQAKQARQQFIQNAMMNYIVSQLERHLLLDAQQRPQLKALLSKSPPLTNDHLFQYNPVFSIMHQAGQIPHAHLADIFTSEQMKAWEQLKVDFGFGPPVVPNQVWPAPLAPLPADGRNE